MLSIEFWKNILFLENNSVDGSWTIFESLVLIDSILKNGENNWSQISKAIISYFEKLYRNVSKNPYFLCYQQHLRSRSIAHFFSPNVSKKKKNEFFQPAKPAKWKSIKNSDVLSSTKWLLMKWGRKNNSLNIRSHWYCQHNWNQWVPNSPTQ